ncbi:O-antigen ligase family protein [Bacillus sp. AGMB 02131]|uniref:O-antigen ligase family protein n=1 Tax=Peribacillus faecalis TaxID=2772559 RepID=A0A927CUY1_9BACI|nr:O-antigen ligase family protein [Peribacillus faecalis]MBD3108287.1 O-antigen ligase family protein [Peribacillus faecalis]
MKPITNENFLKADRFLLTPFYFFWIIAILPKILQLFFLIAILLLFIHKKINQTNIISSLILAYIIIYAISFMVNAFSTVHDSDRLLASLNTLLTWIVAFLYFQVFLNNPLCLVKIRKIVFYNILVLFGLYAFMQMLQLIGMKEFMFFGNFLFFNSWFSGGEQHRFQAFLEYPNLIPLLFMIFLPFTMNNFKNNRVRIMGFIGLILIVVYASLSRSGLLAILAGIFLFLLIRFAASKAKLFIGLLALTSICLITINYLDSYLIDMFGQYASAREGSNATRGNIYSTSIKKAFAESPLIGMGIKDLSPYDLIPFGSHSTYVGFFYKTGIIGFIIGTALVLCLNYKIYKQSKSIQSDRLTLFSCMFLAMTFMLIFEDLDGSNWLLVFYFSVAGVVLNKRNWSHSNENMLSDI